MNSWHYSILLAAAFVPWTFGPAVAAEVMKNEPAVQHPPPARPIASESELRKLNAEVIRTTTAYKGSLENLLGIYEGQLQNLTKEVEQRRGFYQTGYISKRELEESEQKLAHAQANLNETRLRISQADAAITEAEAREELLKLPPLARGAYSETPVLIRFNGGANWSLADAAKIERFFRETFGHLLPVSALGQTSIHNRMRFDHRDAMDVALHPDSPEGRALMAYLRTQGIPFVAFRSRVPGSATGAHIHIGKPSLRAAPL